MKALVIIPTYNEEENIERILRRVLDVDERLDVLVVDDNSPDGTGRIVEELASENQRVSILHRERKLGLGSAYVAGFTHALSRGYDCVFEMDADFSHDPDDLARFLTEIESQDLIIGSRYISGVSVINWPMSRLILSYFANVYAKVVTGVPVCDLTGGFKCFRKCVLEAIDLTKVASDGYAFQIEMNYKAYRRGFRMKEIPIVFVERRSGESKMSKKIVWEAFFLVWRLRLGSILSRILSKEER
jgi:dolichol-phosphate mannosyltransferase